MCDFTACISRHTGLVGLIAFVCFGTSNAYSASCEDHVGDVRSIGVDVVRSFSWQSSGDAIGKMSQQGLADYLVWQLFTVKRIGDVCEDPDKIPDVADLERLYEEVRLDLNAFVEMQNVLRDGNVAENLKTLHSLFRQAAADLARQYQREQLQDLAQKVSRIAEKTTNKPFHFELGSIELGNREAFASVLFASSGASSVESSETLVTAPLHFRFEQIEGKWFFAGIDEKKMLADQIKLVQCTDLSKLYIPMEFRHVNVFDSCVRWSLARSRQSEHFVVFWGQGYGAALPTQAAPEFRVDIDDLLAKAELFFQANVERMKFAELGNSNLDRYKMLLFVVHSKEWIASGAGVDDVIGALWISPSTCQPVGSTVAHEIGHCFQHQVHCDLKGRHGFRYGFGGGGGNGFWEQSAQWQAFQTYPEEIFLPHQLDSYFANCHRHFHHELMRYESYFLPYYWQEKHGPEIMGRIWREGVLPEDPLQAYMRITGIDTEMLHDEIYDAATKMATWDIEPLNALSRQTKAGFSFEGEVGQDGFIRVSYSRCPGTTGFNVIPLKLPPSTGKLRLQFKGLAGHAAYNKSSRKDIANWRYGFVARSADGKRTYGTMHQGTNGSVEFEMPTAFVGLWLVVTGAPSEYQPHAWDDNEKNDDQWPYEFRLEGTTVEGNLRALNP